VLVFRRGPFGRSPENLLAVEAAILDEDLRDLVARRDAARNKHARHGSLQRIGIDLRPSRFGIERNPDSLKQLHVRVESDQGIDAICRDAFLVAEPAAHHYLARRDLDHLTREAGLNLTRLDAILEVGA